MTTLETIADAIRIAEVAEKQLREANRKAALDANNLLVLALLPAIGESRNLINRLNQIHDCL